MGELLELRDCGVSTSATGPSATLAIFHLNGGHFPQKTVIREAGDPVQSEEPADVTDVVGHQHFSALLTVGIARAKVKIVAAESAAWPPEVEIAMPCERSLAVV